MTQNPSGGSTSSNVVWHDGGVARRDREGLLGQRAGTLWYYRSVVAALSRGWSHWLVDDLRTSVIELHAICGEPLPSDWETNLDWDRGASDL